MKTKLTRLFAGCVLASAFFAGCEDAPDDAPKGAPITIKSVWPQLIPESFTARIGSEEALLTQAVAAFPVKMPAGTYPVHVWNTPDAGMTLDGTTATALAAGDYIASIARENWIYSYEGETTIVAGERNEVVATMAPQVRQLNLLLTLDEASSAVVSGISAELSGVAKRIDIFSGALSASGTVKPDFRPEGSGYAASVNLFGIESRPELTVRVATSYDEFEYAVDLSEALATFNDNKEKALDVELAVAGVELGRLTVSVADWHDADIRRQDPYTPTPDGKQVTIEWPGHEIDAVEFYDAEGMMFASTVVDGATVDLYETPEKISRMMVYSGSEYTDVTLHIYEYDFESRTIDMRDDYYISEPAHFGLVRDMDATYYLVADIDCGGKEMPRVGSYPDKPFKGTFEGQGHTISGLKLANGGSNGIFAVNQGTIRDLHVASGSIGEAQSTLAIGAIAGRNGGTIENCTSAVSVTGYLSAGGIAGINEETGKITGCRFSGASVQATNNAAGIAGENHGEISGCFNDGEILATMQAGGIAGMNDGFITRCENTGRVEAGGSLAGGISGACSKSQISASINRGEVSGSGNVGGIVGQGNAGGNVMNCANEGVVTSSGLNVGGIVGMGMMFTADNCSNRASGSVTGRENAGGIFGNADMGSSIRACVNFAQVTASGNVAGGIAGISQAPVTACKNTGRISSNASGVGGLGGICGKKMQTLIACYNTGEVYSESMPNTGGLVGILDSGWNSLISASYDTGVVSAGNTDRFGAILGYAGMNAPVEHCYWANNEHGMSPGSEDPTRVAYLFSAENWPADDASKNWGIGDGSTAGAYWSSLGTPGTTDYPRLYWEAGGATEPLTVELK